MQPDGVVFHPQNWNEVRKLKIHNDTMRLADDVSTAVMNTAASAVASLLNEQRVEHMNVLKGCTRKLLKKKHCQLLLLVGHEIGK